MKNILSGFILLISMSLMAQHSCGRPAFDKSAGLNSSDLGSIVNANFTDYSNSAVARTSAYNKGSNSGVDGSTMLYATWENKAEIFSENKRYVVSNINFDINRGVFLTKMADGSSASFNFDKIDHIKVNQDLFKTAYNSNTGNREVFQVLHEEDEIFVMKGIELVFVEASNNPMSSQRTNKIKQKEVFYIKSDNALNKIKMSKRKLMKLLEEDDHLLLKAQLLNSKNRRTVYKN